LARLNFSGSARLLARLDWKIQSSQTPDYHSTR
jgi:hypothetical protein